MTQRVVGAVVNDAINTVCKPNRPSDFYQSKIKKLAHKIKQSGGNEEMVQGWTVTETVRGTGSSIGHSDIYYIQPITRKKFRSVKEVIKYFKLDSSHHIQCDTEDHQYTPPSPQQSESIPIEVNLTFDMANFILATEIPRCYLSSEMNNLRPMGNWDIESVDLDSSKYESILHTSLNRDEIKQYLLKHGYNDSECPGVFEKWTWTQYPIND